MAETESSKISIDPKNGFCSQSKIYHSLRSSVPLPPFSHPLSIIQYAFSLLHSPATAALSTTPFLIDAATGHHLSYSTFLQQVASLSSSLRSYLSKNDVAFIISPPSLHIPVLYFSLLSLGVVVSPSNPSSSPSELTHQIQLSKPAIAFATSGTAHKLPPMTPVILLDSPQFLSMLESEVPSSANDVVTVNQSAAAAILYSSGTTGKVKGVVLTHRNLIAMIAGLYRYKFVYDERSKDENGVPIHHVSLFTLPLFHVFGFFMLIRAASLGESVVLMERFDFVRMLEAVERHRVTYIPVTPPLVVAMAKSDLVAKYDLSSLQLLGCGGAPLGKEVSERFREKFPQVEISQGDRVHASMKGTAMKLMKVKPVEGHLYALKDFVVADNRMKFKTTNTPLKIIFLRKTKIEEIFDDTFPVCMYQFKQFNELEIQKEMLEFQLFDVIGKVVSFQTPSASVGKGRRMEFKLEDFEHNTITCTLWDEYSDMLLPYMDEGSSTPIVVIIQFGRLSLFGDNIRVCNTYNVTKVVVNGESQHIIDYNSKLINAGMNDAVITTFESKAILSMIEEFSSGQADVKKISEIVAFDKDGIFWVSATILEVEVLNEWCYLACKRCSKKLNPTGRLLNCSKCGTTSNTGTYRYKIEVTVVDKTGTARFMLWDKECTDLVGITAGEVKKKNAEAIDFVPKEVEEALTNKKALFKIQVREGDHHRYSVTYSVTKLTNDKKILALYDEHYGAQNDDAHEKSSCHIEEIVADEAVQAMQSDKLKEVADKEDREIVLKNATNDEDIDFGVKKRKRVMKKEK